MKVKLGMTGNEEIICFILFTLFHIMYIYFLISGQRAIQESHETTKFYFFLNIRTEGYTGISWNHKVLVCNFIQVQIYQLHQIISVFLGHTGSSRGGSDESGTGHDRKWRWRIAIWNIRKKHFIIILNRNCIYVIVLKLGTNICLLCKTESRGDLGRRLGRGRG